jgi:hypothetical protein
MTVGDEARVKRTAAALEANGVSVLRAADAAEAKRIVLGLIPDGSQVHHGASESIEVSGITDEIEKSGRYEPLRPRIWSMDRKIQADEIRRPQDVPVRQEGDATVRVLVGDGSPIELGTPGLILDVELPKGGTFSSPVPSDFNGFVYMLVGEASLGANRLRASRSQIAVLGPGRAVTVEEAQPGTRFMLMAGKPYGETPVYNGLYVD